jgi:hypothetical protein
VGGEVGATVASMGINRPATASTTTSRPNRPPDDVASHGAAGAGTQDRGTDQRLRAGRTRRWG